MLVNDFCNIKDNLLALILKILNKFDKITSSNSQSTRFEKAF